MGAVIKVPPQVRARYPNARWRRLPSAASEQLVWQVLDPMGRVDWFVKVTAAGWFPGAAAEAARTRWAAAAGLPVAEVVDSGVAEDGSQWLVTRPLAGLDATVGPLREDPKRLVTLLAEGLRGFHDAAPTAGCPFDSRIDAALGLVSKRVANGVINPAEDFHPEHEGLVAAERAWAQLVELRPTTEETVVCHGDYCLPNVMIHGSPPSIAGFLDLGELGLADRWWDIAVGAWSVTWNLGPGLENTFYAAYGAEPDDGRIAFYRLLYDMVS